MENRNRALGPTGSALVAGQTISLFGDYIAILALPLFVADLTGRALDLGLTTAFETLPTILFGFVAGVILDRVKVKAALIVADLVRAAAFVALAAAVAGDVAAPWMVFAVAFLVGTMAVGFDSGIQAWMPSLFASEALVPINSALQFARTIAWTLGPAAAGLIVATGGGFALAFAINAATFVASAVAIATIRGGGAPPDVEHPPWRSEAIEGAKYLVREPRLRAGTLAATLVNLTFVPMEALLVLFAAQELGLADVTEGLEAASGSTYIGLFFAGHAAFGALAVIWAPRLIRAIGLGHTFVVGLALLGGGFFGLTLLAPWLMDLGRAYTTAIAIVPAGVAVAGASFTNVAFVTLRQTIPPPEMLGKVIASSRTIAWAGLPVGAALGGVIAEAVGIRPVYLGASVLVTLAALALRATSLWKVRDAV